MTIVLETGEIVSIAPGAFAKMTAEHEDFQRDDARDLARTEEFFKILAKENPAEFTRLLGFFQQQWKNYVNPPWINPGTPIKRKR